MISKAVILPFLVKVSPIPNPVALALMNDIRYKRNLLNGNVFADVNFMKNLVWHTELGYSFNWDRSSTFEPTVHLGNWVKEQNEMRLQKTTGSFIQFKNYLTYNGNFGKHSFTAMLGQECWESKWDYNSSYAIDLPSNDIQNPSLGDSSSFQIGAGLEHLRWLPSSLVKLIIMMTAIWLLTPSVVMVVPTSVLITVGVTLIHLHWLGVSPMRNSFRNS